MKINEHKKLAILAASLGVCRGMLYSVSSGDFNKKDVDAVLAAISPANLAAVFGVPEAAFQIDYTKEITPEELDKIRPVSTS